MSEKTGNLVCVGAICQCNFGTAPAKLKVLTQSKHYINDNKGAKKLMATHKEIGQPFDPPFFGSCSKMNNNPCAVSITAWDGYYEKVKIENDGNPLLEGSKGTCAAGAKDCISIKWHGQTAQPSAQNVHETDKDAMSQINPLANVREMDPEPEKKVTKFYSN
jgi:hypothetical protein